MQFYIYENLFFFFGFILCFFSQAAHTVVNPVNEISLTRRKSYNPKICNSYGELRVAILALNEKDAIKSSIFKQCLFTDAVQSIL